MRCDRREIERDRRLRECGKASCVEADDEKYAAARARWLAELAVALSEAHRLTSALVRRREGSSDAVDLRSRILAARSEVEALQRKGIGPLYPAEFNPFRTSGAWQRTRLDHIP